MLVHAKDRVHFVLFAILISTTLMVYLFLLGLGFFAMVSPAVHIGAIVVSCIFQEDIGNKYVITYFYSIRELFFPVPKADICTVCPANTHVFLATVLETQQLDEI